MSARDLQRGRVAGQREHGLGVERGVVEAALGDQRFGALVEQRDALGLAQCRRGQGRVGGVDGLRLLAGAGQGGDGSLSVRGIHASTPEAAIAVAAVRLYIDDVDVNIEENFPWPCRLPIRRW